MLVGLVSPATQLCFLSDPPGGLQAGGWARGPHVLGGTNPLWGARGEWGPELPSCGLGLLGSHAPFHCPGGHPLRWVSVFLYSHRGK